MDRSYESGGSGVKVGNPSSPATVTVLLRDWTAARVAGTNHWRVGELVLDRDVLKEKQKSNLERRSLEDEDRAGGRRSAGDAQPGVSGPGGCLGRRCTTDRSGRLHRRWTRRWPARSGRSSRRIQAMGFARCGQCSRGWQPCANASPSPPEYSNEERQIYVAQLQPRRVEPSEPRRTVHVRIPCAITELLSSNHGGLAICALDSLRGAASTMQIENVRALDESDVVSQATLVYSIATKGVEIESRRSVDRWIVVDKWNCPAIVHVDQS